MLKVQATFERSGFSNFRVTFHRLVTIWGGTSLLDLFLEVIRQSKISHNPYWRDWDYILNMSESDMPLLPIEDLVYNIYRYIKLLKIL